MQGYIKLHRSLLNWEWWDDDNVLKLFIFCLLRANHKKEKWHGIEIGSGQFVTSYEKLAKSTGLSVRQVRTALNKLKTTGELTSKTTSQNSIITVNNWDMFQQNDKQNDKQMTSERQTNDKRATTNNNDKNEKNIFVVPTIEEIEFYCKERNNKVNASQFYDYYQSKGWMIGKNKMKDWKAAVRTWEQKEKKEVPKRKEWNPYYNVYAEDEYYRRQYGY